MKKYIYALFGILINLYILPGYASPDTAHQILAPITIDNASRITKLRVLKGHIDDVNSIDFNTSANLLASAGWDGVSIWNVETSEEIAHLIPQNCVSCLFSEVLFSPKDNFVVAAGVDGKIWVWDTDNFTELTALEGHSGTIEALAFNPTGEILLSGSSDLTIKVWNMLTFEEIISLEEQEYPVSSIAYFDDGEVFLSTVNDPYIATGNDIESIYLDSNLPQLVGSLLWASIRNGNFLSTFG